MMNQWKPIRPMPPLDERERSVILGAATEAPFAGKDWDRRAKGLYLCRQCGLPLYRSEAKFECGCGWPSFDEALPESVTEHPDPDGRRTEIVCANCSGHLGHIFRGEGMTPKNVRHCVNSLSLSFVPTDSAIFAGGCFWGVEDFFSSLPGVLLATSGYTGGTWESPTYRDVCRGDTEHAEAVRIDFDNRATDYRSLIRKFFEIHDPTLRDRQGPDVGRQYRSAIFYFDDSQRTIAQEAIDHLRRKGMNVVTELAPASTFYPAESNHQAYFRKHPERSSASCHIPREIDWS